MIRHFGRHLYQSVFDHIDTGLVDLGWKVAGGFKEFPVTTQNWVPDEGQGTSQVQPNLVAVTILDEGEEVPEELGDGLVSIDVQLSVDIYGENQAVALAIAEDVKDLLRGRIDGYHRIIPIFDYSAVDTGGTRAALTGVWAENEDVVRIPSQRTELRRQWQVVRWTCHVEYVPTTGGA